MARRTSRSTVSDSLSKSLQNHAKDETNYSRELVNLPAGINGGIAKLKEAKISVYGENTQTPGEKYVRVGAVVIEPKSVFSVRRFFADGKVQSEEPREVDIEGQHFGKNLDICERRGKTLDENVEDTMNELRKLGGEGCTAGIDSEEDLTEVLESIKEESPYFRFSTSEKTPTKEWPEGGAWENWHGTKGFEDYIPEESGDAVVDNTQDEKKEANEPEEVGKDEDDIPFEIDALGEAADAGDGDAEQQLTDKAVEADLNPDDEKYDTWAKLATAINQASEGKNLKDEEGPPEMKDLFNFKPPRAKKFIECEVTAVFPSKETCNLKNLDTQRIYKDIPWDKLEEVG